MTSSDPGAGAAEPGRPGRAQGASAVSWRRSEWTGRRGAAVAAGALGVALIWVVATTTPWRVQPTPAGGPTPVDAGRDFGAAQIAREDAFHHAVLPWSYGMLAAGLAVAAVLGLTPLGSRLVRRVAQPFGGHWVTQAALGGILLAAFAELVALPFEVHNEQVFRRFGTSTQTWRTWGVDLAQNAALRFVVTAVVLVCFFGLVRLAPRTWWAWSGLAGALLVVGVSFAYPVVVEPLFNRFHPLPAGSTRTALLDLAHKDGVRVSQVLVADASRRTTSLNAYVSGFGSTRRIVVYDTLLETSTPEQVRLVVAHELGHAKRNDVLNGTIVGALGVAFACCVGYLLLTSRGLTRRSGIRDIADTRAVALVLFLVAAGTLVATPLESIISRRVEARADVHSLDLTRDPGGFRDMQVRLSLSNLSDLNPNPVTYTIFADHPTGPERIALARDWARRHGAHTP